MLLPVRLREKTKEILRRSNVQIYSLDCIDPAIKDHFLSGKKRVLIFFEKDFLWGRLHKTGQQRLTVETEEPLPPSVKEGDIGLVVLPVSKERRFVLQGQVLKRFLHSVEISIVDPRKDVRFKVIERGFKIFVHQLTDKMVQALLYEKLLFVREINFGLDEFEVEGEDTTQLKVHYGEADADRTQSSSDYTPFEYKAKDYLVHLKARDIYPEYKSLIEGPPDFIAQIVDLSRGGAALSSENGPILTVGDVLAISGNITLSPKDLFDFLLLGVVRGISKEKSSSCIHLMYLKALPFRAQVLFERSFAPQ